MTKLPKPLEQMIEMKAKEVGAKHNPSWNYAVHKQIFVDCGLECGTEIALAVLEKAQILFKALKSASHTEHRPGFCKICDAISEWKAFTGETGEEL